MIGVEEELEKQFKEYMISPFEAINKHGWTFAYDRQHVGYTSGFGHTIDHMSMSRPLQVLSADVVYLTNQKFGNKEKDTDLPLTDHNSVKTTFGIRGVAHNHTFVFRTEYELLNYLHRFRALVCITGFGAKQQYGEPEQVFEDVAKPLFEASDCLDLHFGKGRWVACFGGDPLDEEKPDVAYLVRRLQQKYNMPLIATQADHVERNWGGVDKHIDAVYYYPTEYTQD